MEDVKNAKELLEETVNILVEKKIANKALSDVHKRVLKDTSGDKADWKLLTKVYANKGKAWVSGNPLSLDPNEKHKDMISPLFRKLYEVVKATEAFNQTYNVLSEYFDALEDLGIKISIDPDKFNHLDTDLLDSSLEDELDSAKAYLATIEGFSDEIRNEHTAKAEELNFAPASAYTRVVGIFRKGMSGKEIDDDVQRILTYNEFLDKAVNLTADYVNSMESDT